VAGTIVLTVRHAAENSDKAITEGTDQKGESSHTDKQLLYTVKNDQHVEG